MLSHTEHCIWFIQTYCPHHATLNTDWQNLDGTPAEYREEARQCFEHLKQQGLIAFAPKPPRRKPWRSGEPNFIILQNKAEPSVVATALDIIAKEFGLQLGPDSNFEKFAQYLATKIRRLKHERDDYKECYTKLADSVKH